MENAMSNEISDEAYIAAIQHVITYTVVPSASPEKSKMVEIHIQYECMGAWEVPHERAAQAELDAANEVTDEMIDVIDQKLFGSSILEKSGVVARHNHRENIREALEAALKAKTK